MIVNSVKSQNSKDPGTKNSRVFSFSVGIVCIGNEILTRTLNMGKWAATRMDSLLWEEKLDRIKAFSGRKASGFIHVECFNTRIRNSVLRNLLGIRLAWPKATVFEIVIIGSNPISPAKFIP